MERIKKRGFIMPDKVDLEERIKQLVIQLRQYQKGMPMPKPLDPDIEPLVKGGE